MKVGNAFARSHSIFVVVGDGAACYFFIRSYSLDLIRFWWSHSATDSVLEINVYEHIH